MNECTDCGDEDANSQCLFCGRFYCETCFGQGDRCYDCLRVPTESLCVPKPPFTTHKPSCVWPEIDREPSEFPD